MTPAEAKARWNRIVNIAHIKFHGSVEVLCTKQCITVDMAQAVDYARREEYHTRDLETEVPE